MASSSRSRSATPARTGVVLDAFRSQLWPLPVAAVVLAVLAGVLVPLLDAEVDDSLSGPAAEIWFGGGTDAARAVLTAIAGSLITLTSLTFSLTVVTLQLASGQFSPRLLRTFNQDRYVHVTLALFLSSFAYAMTVLRTVRSQTEDATAEVPRIAVTLAFALAVASVVALVLFLAHLATEIRVETMLRRVHTEGRSTLERPLGASLVTGTPVGWAWGEAAASAVDRDVLDRGLRRALGTGHEPTSAQDITFALSQITDVAAKALSPGINDPRTAIHALGHSAALLVRAAGRELGPTVVEDEDGTTRLYRYQPDLADLLELAVSAPRRYGSADPDVLARLLALLAEVAWSCPDPLHRAAVRAQLARVVATAEAEDHDDVERARLAEKARTVEAALQGEHRSPAQPLLA